MIHMPDNRKEYGEQLRTRRESAGLSIKDLAEAAGLSGSMIKKIENGTVPITKRSFAKIEAGLARNKISHLAQGLRQKFSFARFAISNTTAINAILKNACVTNGGVIPYEYLPLTQRSAGATLERFRRADYRYFLSMQENNLHIIAQSISESIQGKPPVVICLTCGHDWIDLAFVKQLASITNEDVTAIIIHPSYSLLEHGCRYFNEHIDGMDNVSAHFRIGSYEETIPLIFESHYSVLNPRIVCIMGSLNNYDDDMRLMKLLQEYLRSGDFLVIDTIEPRWPIDNVRIIRRLDPRINGDFSWNGDVEQQIRDAIIEQLGRPAEVSTNAKVIYHNRGRQFLNDYGVEIIASIDDGKAPIWSVSGLRVYRQTDQRVLSAMHKIGFRLIRRAGCSDITQNFDTPIYLFEHL